MKEEVTFCDIRQILNILDLNLLLLGNIMVIKLLLLSTHHRQLFCQI